MIRAFNTIKDPDTRHQYADYIVTNCMSVHPHWKTEAVYLKQYIAWLRSMSNTQECLDLLDHALHDKGRENAKD